MFFSILFPNEERYKDPRITEKPEYFKDLNLDQVILSITKGRSEFELEQFFYTPLKNRDTINYRQDVMYDFDDTMIFKKIKRFAKIIYNIRKNMAEIIKDLSDKDCYNNYLTKGRCLNFAELYCDAISSLTRDINLNTLKSLGLKNFLGLLKNYSESDFFLLLTAYIKKLRVELSTVEYCMLIKNGSIRVHKYEQQENHTREIIELFDKFKQGETKDYRHKLYEDPYAEHVEVAVLNMVASLYKDIFEDLNRFCQQYMEFMDDTIALFSCEVQFYISYQEYIKKFRSAGLRFCYPKICTDKEYIYDIGGFDLALADSIMPGRIPVINDFMLNEPERIIVITGPNQGGKTTFARTIGQLHHFGCIGCPVPGTEASLFLYDQMFTHFGSQEDLSTLNGMLQDDLVRLYRIFESATSDSIIIINEIFASTTLKDALMLSKKMMNQIVDLGALTVCVTFLDELASYSTETVSMMSTVQEDDPTQRTYKVVRKKADGLAYAIHIAQKHGLTYESLCRRLKS